MLESNNSNQNRTSRWPFSRAKFRDALRTVLIMVAYLIVFIALDQLSLAFQISPGVVAWYPPDGLSFALLLVFGWRFMPVVALASLVSSSLVYQLALPSQALIVWAIVLSTIYASAAAILRDYVHIDPQLRNLRDVLWLIVFTMIVSVVLAMISIPALIASGAVPATEQLNATMHWWIGEAVGVLTIAPVLLIRILPRARQFIDGHWKTRSMLTLMPRPSIQTVAQALSVLLILYLAFGVPKLEDFQLVYFILVPIIWIALRSGLPGISIGIVTVNFATFFAGEPTPFNIISLTHEEQTLMLLVCVTGLLIGAVVTERNQAEAQIQHQLKRLQGLREIDVAISISFDLHNTLDIVLREVLSHLNADAAAILLLRPHLQTIEYVGSQGFRSEAIQHTQLKLGEGYASRVVLERQMLHMPDLKHANVEQVGALHLEKEGFVDYYGTPLFIKREVKGVLEIYHRAPLELDKDQLDFMEVLAGQAAIAIDNAELFEGLQTANAELEQRVTERTAELNQLNVELEHANSAKDEFLANMSHELRTPLNSILGMSESLLEQRRDPLSDYQQRSLRAVESSGRHLLELINDILDLSKIEAGMLDFYPEILEVAEITRASLLFVKSQAMQKSINLMYAETRTVSKVYADPRRLKQILVNLLTNAVKFTPERGQVTLQVEANEAEDLVQFSVIDNGIGIAPEDLEQLFQPFVQVQSKLNRHFEGTGLGLALVRKLTDLHGGSVQVESKAGSGSRFTINLPWGKAIITQHENLQSGTELVTAEPSQKSNLPADEPARDATILLAEDNAANVLTIGEYLESYGYKIVNAHDGVEAIERAEATNPDIILMDIQMPAMDGLEAMRRLRANSRFTATPIIALTALAMPGDRERCLAAGANEYMSKPVSLKKLLHTVREMLDKGNKQNIFP